MSENPIELNSGKKAEPSEEEAYYAPEPPKQAEIPPEPLCYAAGRPPVPAKPVATLRVRRVGSFTMGLALIVSGILLLLFLAFRNYELLVAAAKWSPLILVSLGIEVLASNALFHKDKLKYDFLSAFFCAIVIFGSFCVSTIPLIYQNGPLRSEVENALSQEISNRYYQELKGQPEIASLAVRVSIGGMVSETLPKTYQNLGANDFIYTDVELLGLYDSPLAFAQQCKPLIDKMKNAGVDFERIRFTTLSSDKEYELDISDRFQIDMPAETLAELVSTTEGTAGNNKRVKS